MARHQLARHQLARHHMIAPAESKTQAVWGRMYVPNTTSLLGLPAQKHPYRPSERRLMANGNLQQCAAILSSHDMRIPGHISAMMPYFLVALQNRNTCERRYNRIRRTCHFPAMCNAV
jgi:hypothetical protein